jgi:uncharacterized protein YfaT (DUF1175 family)
VFPTRALPYVAGIVLAALGSGCSATTSRARSAITFAADRNSLAADGFSTAELVVRTSAGEVVPAEYSIVRGKRIIRIEGSHVRATVNPGTAVIQARFGKARSQIEIITIPVYSDRAFDGTPDFLRLDDLADRAAFADSFAYIAEAQYFRRLEELPAEITDCSALIRYAYRETLREHDREWATAVRIQHASIPGQPSKYHYPFTPLGAKLFRNLPGPFRESDVLDKSFSEFADAESLRRFNAHFISRDVRRAQRGDLLFYKQPDQRSPAHAMIFMAESQIEVSSDKRVVYHTGPIGRGKGEMRRPTVQELLNHPHPQWRPTVGNSNFLGVYRWNILRQES